MRALAVAALALGCAPSLPSGYACNTNSQCLYRGAQGVCEPTGACSFADASCAGGRRYGDLGPPALAGNCVGAVGNGDMGSSGGGMIARVATASLPEGAPVAMTATLPAPPSLRAGDFVFACVFVNDRNATINGTGWTQHASLTGGVTGNFHAVWLWRFVAANDPSSYGFIVSAGTRVAAVAVAYRGVAATPIDAASNRVFEAAPFDAPSITTTHANDMLLAVFVEAQNTAPSWTAPTGMQTAVDDQAIAAFDAVQPAAGASGDKLPNASLAIPAIGAVDFVALAPN